MPRGAAASDAAAPSDAFWTPEFVPPPGSAFVLASDDVVWAPRAGWAERAPARPVGEAFSESIEQLSIDAAGRAWVLRSSRKAHDDWSRSQTLEVYGDDGRRRFVIPPNDQTQVHRFTLHPSGELTLFEQVWNDARDRFALRLRRLAADGTALAERPLDDGGRAEERVEYRLAVGATPEALPYEPMAPSCPDFPTDACRIFSFAVGEEVIFSLGFHGVKLYRLDARLAPLWDVQVMHADSFMHAFNPSEVVTVDAEGETLFGWTLWIEQLEAYRMHFDRALAPRGGEMDILVQRIGPDGQWRGHQSFGPGAELLRGMHMRPDGEIVLGGDERVRKFDRPNDTTEWDLVLLRARFADGALTAHRHINLAREDLVTTFVVSGDDLLFGGTTDALQVDTNSLVEPGTGFLVRTSAAGDVHDLLLLPGPRHVQVDHVVPVGPRELRFSGSFDAPITHTGDADRTLTYRRAMLGSAAF